MTGNKNRFFIGLIRSFVVSCLILTISSTAFAQAKSGASLTFTAADEDAQELRP